MEFAEQIRTQKEVQKMASLLGDGTRPTQELVDRMCALFRGAGLNAH